MNERQGRKSLPFLYVQVYADAGGRLHLNDASSPVAAVEAAHQAMKEADPAGPCRVDTIEG
jgi:hypothetical protein